MNELIELRSRQADATLESNVIARFAETQGAIRSRSRIQWEEHCSECAFPYCYGSCAFYTPRDDLNCRRFENGFEAVTADGLALTRIGFRKWAKMEGRGPAELVPAGRAARGQSIVAIVKAGLGASATPWRVANALRRRWNDRTRARGIGTPPGLDTCFLVEAFNPSESTLAFTVTLTPEDKTIQALFQRAVDFAPGYSRAAIPTRDIGRLIDLSEPHLIQIEPVGNTRPTVLFGVVDFVDAPGLDEVSGKAAQNSVLSSESPARTAKCIVWDLDNTLWDGTLAEDGVEGLTLRAEAHAAIEALDARGILHAIASKNEEGAGFAALDHFGIADYFLAPQINWGPKSESIQRIAQRLDIGLNSLIFLDDQPFERGEVASACPSVECLPDTAARSLVDHPRLQAPVTAESARRRQMYREQDMRRSAALAQPTDYIGFLRSCDLRLDVLALDEDRLTRAAELSERTNQLNFSGSRISRAELSELIGTRACVSANLLRCQDRFGDYGVIGLALVDWQRARITDFMMSCRVQRKKVEQAYFKVLDAELRKAGHSRIEIAYRPTPRNGASRSMLEEMGFTFEAQDDGDAGIYMRALGIPWGDGEVVKVHVADDAFTGHCAITKQGADLDR